MSEYLPVYAMLKMIALLWSTGELSTGLVRELRRLGVEHPSQLDRIIHELHVEYLKNAPYYINAEGDGLVLVGLVEGAGVEVYEAEGDGWRRPLKMMTENGFAVVKLGPNTSHVLFEVDYPIDMYEFIDTYGPQDEETPELTLPVEREGDKNRVLVGLNPILGVTIVEALTYYGAWAEFRGKYVVTNADPDTIASAIRLAHHVMEEDFDKYVPGSMLVEEILSVIEGLRRAYRINVKVESVPRTWKTHVHDESTTVHVHGVLSVTITAPPGRLLLDTSALIVALNHNLLKGSAEKAVEDAGNVYRVDVKELAELGTFLEEREGERVRLG